MDLNSKDLASLLALAQTRMDIAYSELARVAERERAVRLQLEQLDTQFEQAKNGDTENQAIMQSLGARQLWLGWARQKRSELNFNLARVLANKSEKTQRLKTVIGQRDALNDLLRAARARDARKLAKKEQDRQLIGRVDIPLHHLSARTSFAKFR